MLKVIIIFSFVLFLRSCWGADPEFTYLSECEDKTEYSVTDAQCLDIELIYDAGVLPDIQYITNLCLAKETYKSVSLKFAVGYDLEEKDGKVRCVNPTEGDDSCSLAIQHACASKLVTDFSKFVCCTVLEGEDPLECVTCQNEDKIENGEWEQCVNLEHKSINPQKLLVENSKNSKEKYEDLIKDPPILLFNQVFDNCAQYNFYAKPDEVICAMLEADVEPACEDIFSDE